MNSESSLWMTALATPVARWVMLSISVALVVVGCTGNGTIEARRPTASPSKTAFPRLVDVGGYSLWIDCFGEGAPVVILDTGLGGDATDWDRIVQPGIETITRVCVYDRAGQGASDPRPPGTKRVTSGLIADELHTLLGGADVHPPYVLVGLSFGGMVIRSFEGRYPQEVAGVVLVDSSSEWQVLSPRWARHTPLAPETPEGRIDFEQTATELQRAGPN